MSRRPLTRTEWITVILAALGILVGIGLMSIASHLGGLLLGTAAALLGAAICLPSLGILIVAMTSYPHVR